MGCIMRFHILAVKSNKLMVFWNVRLCSVICMYQCLGENEGLQGSGYPEETTLYQRSQCTLKRFYLNITFHKTVILLKWSMKLMWQQYRHRHRSDHRLTCQHLGYSQSRSSPSKSYFSINSRTVFTKFALDDGLFTSRLYLSPRESFQPPIAISTFTPRDLSPVTLW